MSSTLNRKFSQWLQQILPGTFRADEVQIYRTKDGGADYKFRFVSTASGTERAYILWQPDYGARDKDAHTTHRYWDSEKQLHYICFDPEPRSRNTMKSVAKQWAENTERYRKNGIRF